jgi:hypothetical protein
MTNPPMLLVLRRFLFEAAFGWPGRPILLRGDRRADRLWSTRRGHSEPVGDSNVMSPPRSHFLVTAAASQIATVVRAVGDECGYGHFARGACCRDAGSAHPQAQYGGTDPCCPRLSRAACLAGEAEAISRFPSTSRASSASSFGRITPQSALIASYSNGTGSRSVAPYLSR